MQTGYRIEAMDPNQMPIRLMESCASLYCEIWKEPPWNEDFWTVEMVMEALQNDLSQKQSRGFFALPTTTTQNARVIGFTWGYQVNKEDMQHISGTAEMDPFFKNGNTVFYIDELGVDSKSRIKGIGTSLSTNLLDWASETSHNDILLRTDVRALPARALYAKLGFTELGIIDAQEHGRTYWHMRFR